jgi:hypothetical protein
LLAEILCRIWDLCGEEPKLEVRLGGIYSLERISNESPGDYWTVMENLPAFVRERSRRNEAERTSRDLEQRLSCRAYLGSPHDLSKIDGVDGARFPDTGEM